MNIWRFTPFASPRPLCIRHFTATARRYQSPRKVDSSSKVVSLDIFRQVAFSAERPLQFQAHPKSLVQTLPAQSTWFTQKLDENGKPSRTESSGAFAPFIRSLPPTGLPIEIATPEKKDVDALRRFGKWLSLQKLDEYALYASLLEFNDPPKAGGFTQLLAPLGMLVAAVEHNQSLKSISQPVQMYIAQCGIGELNPQMREDVRVPELVMTAGRGDVYNTSVWLGTEPTFTPLHEDPNPNLFYQLHNRKYVRLLPPEVGLHLYGQVQRKLGRTGNPKIRQEEMMSGEERVMLHDAVWENNSSDVREADLGPGDCLYIPKGWWHSVKSQGNRGLLNGSVNWWFR